MPFENERRWQKFLEYALGWEWDEQGAKAITHGDWLRSDGDDELDATERVIELCAYSQEIGRPVEYWP
jgi:hypothetical protein